VKEGPSLLRRIHFVTFSLGLATCPAACQLFLNLLKNRRGASVRTVNRITYLGQRISTCTLLKSGSSRLPS
jgi:hypothetical protein